MAAAGVLALAWAGPITLRVIQDFDFPFHLATAESFAANGEITVPHFLFQVALGGLYATGAFPSIESAALLFLCTLHVATAAIICWFIARGSRGPGALAASAVLAVLVLMSGPILAGAVDFNSYLIGYFPPNAYHNPTMILAKPLLLSLLAAVMVVTRTSIPNARELVMLSLPVGILGLAKPNYIGCLVPVIGLTAVSRWRSGQPISWQRVTAFCGAGVGVVAGILVLYGTLSDAGSGIQFAPFAVLELHQAVNPVTIVAMLLASIAFPLAAVALWPRAIWRDMPSRLALTALPIALLISYGLAEAGDRMGDGNFLWTGQMAVFVAFVTTAAFARVQLSSRPTWSSVLKGGALAGVLALHVDGGIRHALLNVPQDYWLTWWK